MLTAALLWGAAFVAQKVGAESLGPFSITFLRNLEAGVFLSGCWWARRLISPRARAAAPAWTRRTIVGGAVCGAALFAASLSQQVGIMYTTPGISAFLTSNYVLFVPVIGLAVGRRAHPLVWAAVVVALAGSYLICLPDGADGSIGRGELWTLLCAVLFSVQILVVDRFAPGCDVLVFSCIQQFSGAALSLPFVLLLGSESAIFSAEALVRSALPVLFIAVFSSGIAYTCQNLGQKRTPPALASLVMATESVFGAVFGWLWFGDQMSLLQLAGCALVFAAVVVASVAPLPTRSVGSSSAANRQ